MKSLFFGDCLEVLKEFVPNPAARDTGFIDLIYNDPPFNSKRDYNILFEDVEFKDTTAQKKAFADTWSNVSYLDTLSELQSLNLGLYNFLKTLDGMNVSKSAVSYLTTMAIRILYMHKVLKDTGSFYLHCDPTMSHYLKILCDVIFGEKNFRNEIVWKRSTPHNDAQKFGSQHDIIFYYVKSDSYIWNRQYIEHSEEYKRDFYKNSDLEGRKYSLDSTTAPGGRGPEYEFLGITRKWRYTKENMQRLYDEGLIIQTKPGTVPRFKRYLDEQKGVTLQDVWIDIKPLQGQSKEYMSYPTQKPEALLERIIRASSNEGDLVADFFCGCGTSIAVAERLKRNWLGVDISHLAVKLIKKRLTDKVEVKALKGAYSDTILIKGFPQDVASAYALARQDYELDDDDSKIKKTKGRLQFQEWVVEVMLNGVVNPKVTADGGWDGHTVFALEEGKKETVLIEVKSGNVNVKNIREFIQVVEAQSAAMGVFVCFGEQVTRPMLEEITKQGYFREDLFGKKYGKVQILTVEDLFNGQNIKMPDSTYGVFKRATNNNGGAGMVQETMPL